MTAGPTTRPTWVEATLLPARAAYLIRAGSKAGLRKAVQEACSRWGGMAEPIIPVRRGGRIDPWWRQVLQLSGVEGLVDVDAGADAHAVAADLKRDLTPLNFIDRYGPTMWTCHPTFVGSNSLETIDVATKRRELWEVVAAGDVTDEHADFLRGEGITAYRPSTEDQVARAMLEGETLIDATIRGFHENATSGDIAVHPALIWVTKRNGYSDCLWFWNLRALRSLRFVRAPMFLLSADGVEHWVQFADRLADTLRRPSEFQPDVLLCSRTIPQATLQELAEHLALERGDGKAFAGHRFPAPLRERPFTYGLNLDYRQWVTFEREYGSSVDQQVLFVGETGTLRFDSPIATRAGGYTLARFRSSAFNSYPKRDEVASQIYGNAVWRGNQIQISTTTSHSYWLELRLPPRAEVLEHHLARRTAKHGLSDKGRLASGLLDLAQPTELLHAGLPQAVSALTTPRSQSLLRDLRRMRRSGADDTDLAELAHRWGQRGPRRYRSARDLTNRSLSKATEALEALCQMGWAERGLETACTRCGISSFVPFSESDSHAHCPGCSTSCRYTIASEAVEIFYRLNAYVDRASDQGAVPQAVAAAALQHTDPDTTVLPGVDVQMDNGKSFEIDILAIHQAHFVAGEVKTSPSEFTQEQLLKDIDKTRLVGADVHLLATIYELTSQQLAQVQELATRAGLELLIIDRALLQQLGSNSAHDRNDGNVQ